MKPAIVLLFGAAIFVFGSENVFAQGRGSPCELVCRPPAVIDVATCSCRDPSQRRTCSLVCPGEDKMLDADSCRCVKVP